MNETKIYICKSCFNKTLYINTPCRFCKDSNIVFLNTIKPDSDKQISEALINRGLSFRKSESRWGNYEIVYDGKIVTFVNDEERALSFLRNDKEFKIPKRD